MENKHSQKKHRDTNKQESVLTADDQQSFTQMPIAHSTQNMNSEVRHIENDPNQPRSFFDLELFRWLRKLFTTYDNSILIVLGLVYFLQGFKVFLALSVKDLFKLYLNLDPSYAQFLHSLTSIPWSCKILYGLICDNLPILGSRRKAYIILNGGVQCLTLWFLVINMVDDEIFITIMLVINALNSAFLDVVVDALMVRLSRQDPVHGSQDLQGLSWALLAIGGIFGSVCSAFFTEFLRPQHTFLACSFFSLIIVVAGYFINPVFDEPEDERETQGFCNQLKENMRDVKKAMQIPQLYRTVLFLIICGLVQPSFGDFAYYFQINIIQFTKFTISMLGIVGYLCLLLGTVIYKKYLQDYEIRTLFRWAIYIGFTGSIFSLMFALRVNVAIGISDLLFVLLTGVVFDILILAFTQLPQLVLFAKITPKNIEATVFAVLTGVYNFSTFVIAPNIGVIINKLFIGVTIDNLENYYKLVIVGMTCSLIPLVFLRLIPSRKEMDEVQQQNDTMIFNDTGTDAKHVELTQINK